MATLKYIAGADLMTVTLDSAYTAGSGTMALTAGHGARLPTAGDFWLRTTTGTYRCFKVTARSTDTLTVTAAQDGTSDGNLDAATELKWVLGATAFDQFRSDLVQTGADASKAAEKAGKLYLPSNGFSLYRDTGAAMVPWGPIFPLTLHDDSGFSWVNQGGSTVDTTSGGVYIYSPANASDNLHLRCKSKSAPYVITIGLVPAIHNVNYNSVAVGWRQSSDGKLVTVLMTWNSSNLQKYNSATSYNSSYSGTSGFSANDLVFIQLIDDSTNRIVKWSRDGKNFIAFHTVGRTDFLTADQVFYGLRPLNSTIGCGATIISWKEE